MLSWAVPHSWISYTTFQKTLVKKIFLTEIFLVEKKKIREGYMTPHAHPRNSRVEFVASFLSLWRWKGTQRKGKMYKIFVTDKLFVYKNSGRVNIPPPGREKIVGLKLCWVIVSFVRWGHMQNFRPLGPLFLVEVEFVVGWWGGEQQYSCQTQP